MYLIQKARRNLWWNSTRWVPNREEAMWFRTSWAAEQFSRQVGLTGYWVVEHSGSDVDETYATDAYLA